MVNFFFLKIEEENIVRKSVMCEIEEKIVREENIVREIVRWFRMTDKIELKRDLKQYIRNKYER